MDFTRTEAAQDLSGLVGTIVDAVCTPGTSAPSTLSTNDSTPNSGPSSSTPTS